MDCTVLDHRFQLELIITQESGKKHQDKYDHVVKAGVICVRKKYKRLIRKIEKKRNAHTWIYRGVKWDLIFF